MGTSTSTVRGLPGTDSYKTLARINPNHRHLCPGSSQDRGSWLVLVCLVTRGVSILKRTSVKIVNIPRLWLLSC